MRYLIICSTVFFGAACNAPAATDLKPIDLRCEYRSQPLGIGESRPRLGWKLAASDPAARGLGQTGYQLLVASSPMGLSEGHADLWDTGKVGSDRTQNVVYSGRQLTSQIQCWWKVRIWDQNGEVSAWSEPAAWTMGLLNAADWHAEWIGLDAKPPADGSTLSESQYTRIKNYPWMITTLAISKTTPVTACVRRAFTVPPSNKPLRATLIVTGDQICTITANGRSFGEIARWDRAHPIDITAAVVPGENVVGFRITQSDGYPPAALGEIELAPADGDPVRIPIDTSWRFAVDPPAGWDRPGFSDEAWHPLEVIPNHESPWGSPENATEFLAPPPFLRKSFTVVKAMRRASIYATALGLYELQLNGARVGHDYFTPGWTDYLHRVQYRTYDVTSQLKSGDNVLGAILGDGWFAGTLAFTGQQRVYGGYPRLMAQLEIEYVDGTHEIVATDGTWRAAFGSNLYADIYQGCATDERRGWPDWSRVGFDDRGWAPVVTGLRPTTPDSPLVQSHPVVEAATVDPVSVVAVLSAKAVTSPTPDVYVADFGQNIVGWVKLKVRGSRGQKITLRHGEMLNPNGTVYTSNLRGAAATDVYWLRGEGEETLEPRFTFHGFRYVEITGLDAAPAATNVEGVVVHSALARAGDFTCSDPRVNQLFRNIIWGQMGNYLEVPTDCPQRDERLGWTGDTQFFIRTAAFNFDVASFIERWLMTLVTDEQGSDGTFPDVAPSFGRPATAVTGWGDAAIVCTHALWEVYGDMRVVERHFDELARYIAWLQAHAKGGIVRVGGYGDWVNLGGGAKTEVIDTAYYSYLCGLMAEMARAIGRSAAADYYAALQQDVTAAFQRTFVQSDGSILESSQTGYALAFTMNLLPDELRAKAAERFVAEIAARDWHLATGFIGTPRLLPALHLAGRDDVAYRLLLQDTYPSWLFQVKQGATTMWERWDGWTPDKGFQTISMNSFNHYAFGSVGEYLYRVVAGIDTEGPGFRRILIHPLPKSGLSEASAHYDGPTGRIVSAWRITGGTLTLDVTIPPNTSATVHVPTSDARSVRESGRPAREAPGVTFVAAEKGGAVFRVGSGNYRFEAGQ